MVVDNELLCACFAMGHSDGHLEPKSVQAHCYCGEQLWVQVAARD